MDIKIIDANSNNGIILRNRVLQAVGNLDEKITISLITNNEEIKKYNLKKYPGLIINNNLTIEGRIITIRELERILNNELKKKKNNITNYDIII